MVIFSIAELADWIFFFSSFLFKNLWTYQVIHQKPKKTLNEITKELCPVRASSFESLILYWTYFFSLHASFWCYCLWLHQVLSIQQLYRISTMYWDDKYGTHSVSSDVSLLQMTLKNINLSGPLYNIELLTSVLAFGILKISLVWTYTGYFKHESFDDWGLKQCCKQLFPIRRWLKVLICDPQTEVGILYLIIHMESYLFFLCSMNVHAAYHSRWTTSPSQCNK